MTYSWRRTAVCNSRVTDAGFVMTSCASETGGVPRFGANSVALMWNHCSAASGTVSLIDDGLQSG